MSPTLMVGIDGSDASRRAAAFAARQAVRMQTGLSVVYVIEWSPFTFNTAEENEQRHRRREEEIDTARSHVLQPMLAELDNAELDVAGHIHHGHVAAVLIRLAKEHGAIELFVGRLGQSPLQSLLFGSVASQLVQSSPVPVTVVP